jgi:phosphatidylserine/phosphatidylglycerophosphate/cardiolipin synthase-like enzyme
VAGTLPAHVLDAARNVIGGVDRVLGQRVTAAVCAHHRRRLGRIGWEGAMDGDAGDGALPSSPVRHGNACRVLIDGEEAFGCMVEALGGARSHVSMTGWFLSPDFALRRGEDPLVLRNLLAELAERIDVRVLLWAGAPLPLFHPSRADARHAARDLCHGSRIRCALDSHERPLHCHHEKLLIVDDLVAFVGGIDATTKAGDRFDSGAHPSRAAVGWHDAAARVEGPVVSDVARHFAMRWHEVTGERLPDPPPPADEAGDVSLQLIRTVPERVYKAEPRGEFSILAAYTRLIRSARELIYLESQYLWSAEIGVLLADKLRNPPSDRFRLVVMLPAKPYGGGDDTRGMLSELIDADSGADRLLACTLYARSGAAADPIYVHAKVGIVDDRVLTLGSANLNDHSLFNDTEVNLLVDDAQLARQTRLRLWSEHLECHPEEIDGDPVEVVDRRWRPLAAEQLRRRRAGEPLSHRLMLLPNLSRRTARLLGPLQGLLVDG